MALLTMKEASFAYDSGIVVEDISFSIENGEYLCIVGENGSGKSTLLKGMLRFIKPRVGIIQYGNGLKPYEIGYIPQQTQAQKDFPASVYEVVLSGRLNSRGIKPFYSQEDKTQAMMNLELLGIDGLKKRCYRELSGGQQQRVLLARALCATSRLLVLDEPTTGLDPTAAQDLYRILDSINHEKRITIIMVSHDIMGAVKHAGYILHVQKTHSFFGTVKDYMTSRLWKAYEGGSYG